MKIFQKIWHYILILAILELIACLFFSGNYTTSKSSYLSQKIKELQLGYDVVIKMYALVSSTIYNEVINQPDVLNIFKNAYTADREDQAAIRKQLFNLLYPTYRNLKKKNLKQLHFHLPNCTSFLRFHRPDKFGDDLSDTRYSVKLANSNRVYTEGFEKGRIHSGFRFVFPLFFENQHIGSVETSISFNAIREVMAELFPGDFSFILKKLNIDSKVFPEEKENYIPSNLSQEYSRENPTEQKENPNQPDKIEQSTRENINRSIRKRAKEKFKTGKPFAIWTDVDNEDYIVSFLPIFNLKKQQVAYIISYTRDKTIDNLQKHFILKLVAVAGFLLIAGAFIYYRKRGEEKLVLAKEAAEAGEKSRADFLATMSHEIRTPMNGVIGMTGLLLETSLSEEQKEFVETIRMSGESLLTIINDILDFSKIESGKLALEEHPFQLSACIEEILELLGPEASKKQLELLYLIEPDVPPFILGDITRLRQILVNLVGNAVKFTEEGEILIAVSRVDSVSDRIRFSIRDTGIGISKEQVDRLFKPFTQADPSTTRRYGGTGLGLTIAGSLVRLMGGDIKVESKVGEGSTFIFTIRSRPAPDYPEKDQGSSLNMLYGRRILIVDDNPTNLRVMAIRCRNWGMVPTTAASGEEALEIIERGERFEVAILDMHMPGMNGITLGLKLYEMRDRFKMPLILVSSLGKPEEGADLPSDLFSGYLSKPIRQSQLVRRLLDAMVPEKEIDCREEKPATSKINYNLSKQLPLQILVAEDNPVNLKVALRFLEKMGYHADSAKNGKEALESALRKHYDIIFMDIKMPVISGLDAAGKIIRKSPPEKRPRIIAMTAAAMAGDRDACLKAGMDDYISKPIRMEDIQAIIKLWGKAGFKKS